MDEMIRYIFGSMRTYNRNFVVIAKVLKNQNKINRLFVVQVLCLLGLCYFNDRDIRQLNERIKALEAEKTENKGA